MMESLDKNVVRALDDIIQNQQHQKEYNIFLIGPNESGKSTIQDLLEQQKKENFAIYECNSFPKMEVFQTNHLTSILKHYSQINNSRKSLILFVFSQSEIIIKQSQKIFDYISKVSQGVTEAFIIFNFAEQENYIKRFQKFLSNYDSRKKELSTYTCLLLDKIITEDKIIFIKCEQNSSEITIQNQIMQQLFEQKSYHSIQIQHIFNDQALDLIKQHIRILNELIQKNQNKIILSHIQNLIKICFPERQSQLAQSLQEDYQTREKYYKYQQVFESLKLFQEQNNQIQINEQDNILHIIENNKNYIQGDTLYIICSKYSTKQLQQLYQDYQQKNETFNKVFIFSLFYFVSDEDIKMPGISVYIYTYYFDVVKNIKFDLSGADGYSYDKAQNGKNQLNKIDEELDGQNGKDGEPGQNGGSFLLNSKIFNNFQNVEFYLRGGNGGKGQDGGDGANGVNGEDAQTDQVNKKNQDYICDVEPVGTIGSKIVQNLMTFNSTLMVIFRSEGQPGQRGGNAGSGGFGGKKGQDGIYMPSKSFSGRINYKNQITLDGQNGKSGIPGKGGKNGRDYEGQYQDTFVFGDLRDFGTKKQSCVGQQSATIVSGIAGGVAAGVKLTPKLLKVAPSIGTKLVSFLEAQLGAKLSLGFMGGGSVILLQAIFSSIQLLKNYNNDFIRLGYIDKGEQPEGQTLRLIRKNNQNQNIPIQLSNQQFSVFVNENKLLFSNQIPFLNQLEEGELFREQ